MRRVAPWVLGALALGGIAALAGRSGGPADPLGPVIALAAAPLMTLWFACVAILARRILQLRDHAREALGSRFDIRDFHGVVIENGALPLDVLSELVERYISEHRS